MMVSQEWPLRYQSYDWFMGMLRAWAESRNDNALLLLGLVRNCFLSLLNTTIYLMPVFGGRRNFTIWVRERRGSNTCSRQRTTDMMKRRTCLAS
jgi:hypothetical protein